MLKLKYFDIISKAQNYIHVMKMKKQRPGGKGFKLKPRGKLFVWNWRTCMEKNAIFQVEDNFLTVKQLEDLSGCSFSFMIDPKISEDGDDDDDSKVTMCAFR